MKNFFAGAACIALATASAIGVMQYKAKIDTEAARMQQQHESLMQQQRALDRANEQLRESSLRPDDYSLSLSLPLPIPKSTVACNSSSVGTSSFVTCY